MKKIQILTVYFLLTVLLSACSVAIFCKEGNGNITSENREIKNFTEIEFSTIGELVLIQSDTPKIIIEATENIISDIETIYSEGKLTIKSKVCLVSQITPKIYIYCNSIEKIELDGSGTILNQGANNFENLHLILDGSGSMAFENITINDKLITIITGSGDLQLKNVITNDLHNEIIGSGDITIENISSNNSINEILGSGNIVIKNIQICDNFESIILGDGDIEISSPDTIIQNYIKIMGSGTVINTDLKTLDITTKIEGSGDAYIHAINILKVDILGSGNVYYKGNPTIILNISGSGELINNN